MAHVWQRASSAFLQIMGSEVQLLAGSLAFVPGEGWGERELFSPAFQRPSEEDQSTSRDDSHIKQEEPRIPCQQTWKEAAVSTIHRLLPPCIFVSQRIDGKPVSALCRQLD